MPEFKYTAKSEKDGMVISDTMVSPTKSALAKDLRQKKYFLISAEVVSDKKKKKNLSIFPGKISLQEKMFFTRNLKIMLSGGLSFARALHALSEQTKNERFKNVILEIKGKITSGSSFSQALEDFPNVFSEVFRNMIKLSEESGTMEKALENLTSQMEREYELKSKIKGALIYPAVIVCAMGGIGVIFLTVFIPQLAATFDGMGAELPVFTSMIVGIGTFLSEKWYFVLLSLVLFFYLLKNLIKTPKGKRVFDAFLLKIPIASAMIRKGNTAYFAKTMGSLLFSGVPMIKSMEIFSRSVSNVYFAESIKDATKVIERGGKLSSALLPYTDLYGTIAIQMIEVGEETGQTSDMLLRVASFLDEEVMNTTKNLTAILEPFLMIFIGVAIGIFALAVIQPIYSMLDYI